MKTSAVLLFSALVFGTVANADPVPLPLPAGYPSTLATPIVVYDAIGPNGTNGSQYRVNGNAGAFYGTLGGGLNSPMYTTAFWCVDTQTYFSPGTPGLQANVTLLSDTNGLAADTWYGTDGAPSGWAWTNSVDGLSAKDTVQHRLEMAAFLVQQYGYSSYGEITGTSAKTSYSNTDVQNAIWAVMNNSLFATSPHNDPTILQLDVSTAAGVKYWVTQAATAINAGQISPADWAVVSWNAPLSNNGQADQTFLVRVTPEPGFYGALALGMSGLALMISRKRKSA